MKPFVSTDYIFNRDFSTADAVHAKIRRIFNNRRMRRRMLFAA